MTTFFAVDKDALADTPALIATLAKGGPGSGNFGHAGRRGKIGGSAPDGEGRAAAQSPRTGRRKPLQANFVPARRIRNRTPKDDQAFPSAGPRLGRQSKISPIDRIFAKQKPALFGEKKWQMIFDKAEQENKADPLGHVVGKLKSAGHGLGSIPKSQALKGGKKSPAALAEVAKEAPGKADEDEITEVFKVTGKTFTYLLNVAQVNGPGVELISPDHWGQLAGANLEDYLQFAMSTDGDPKNYAGMIAALPRRRALSKGLVYAQVAPDRLLDWLAAGGVGIGGYPAP